MTTLFSAPSVPPAAQQESEKSLGAQLRQGAIFGGGCFGGGSALLAGFELFKSEPDKAFRLLHDWGPWCFLIGISLAVMYMLSTALIRARAESDSRMASAFDRLAAGQERVAVAAEAAAAKDDRQIQQIEVLQTTLAMKIERVLRHLHAQDRALERLEDKAGINPPHEDPDEESNKA